MLTNRARADVNARAAKIAQNAWDPRRSPSDNLNAWFDACENVASLFCEFSQIEDPEMRRTTAELTAREFVAMVTAP
jgi:hypothetical protein